MSLIIYVLPILILVLALALIILSTSQYKLIHDFRRLSKIRTGLGKKTQEKLLQKAEKKIDQEIEKLTQNLSERLENASANQIEQFRIGLQEEVNNFRTTIEQKMDQEFSQVAAEIAEYKQKRLAQIDVQVEGLVKEVSAKVLGHSIEPKDHEKIVEEAVSKLES